MLQIYNNESVGKRFAGQKMIQIKSRNDMKMLDYFFFLATPFVYYGSRFFGRGRTYWIKEIHISPFILNNFRRTWPPMCEETIDLLLENWTKIELNHFE